MCERKFEEIVVGYPPAELCTYPEYRGKPYFSIKYEENGKHIIGFGTYNPEVLSRYLRDYFIVPKPNTGRCKDCRLWKDSDGTYRRGLGAESQCPINCKEVYEGNGYCFMYAPQEN